MSDGSAPELSTPLEVSEDVQERVGPESYVVYEPATGPELENDLVQRGIFWHEEHAELFAAAPELRDALEELLVAADPEAAADRDEDVDEVRYRQAVERAEDLLEEVSR